jgi:hypothetical protein
MDKLESKKLSFILEVLFVVFLAVFVAFTSVAMAVSWEVSKMLQVSGGRLLMGFYLSSTGVVFAVTVLYIARRIDEWAKSTT